MRLFLIIVLAIAPRLAIAQGELREKSAAGGAAPAEAAQAGGRQEGDQSAEAARAFKAPPKGGSQIPADQNLCIQCHGESDLWDEKSRRLFIARDKLDSDVHWKKGVNCTDCHGGNYQAQDVNQAHAKEDGFRSKPEEVRKFCAVCHEAERLELIMGVHGKAGPPNERGQGTMLGCENCHGDVSHHTLPVKDHQSPVFVPNQVKMCGSCHVHVKDLETYKQNVHGQGLYRMGLMVTAACADCHGAHGIYKPADARSSLFLGNVAGTCGKCHFFIEERLQASIHGRGKGAGKEAARSAPGGIMRQHPSCTSCHQGHNIEFPETSGFRSEVPYLCGNCHGKLSSQYAMSIHGELSELGYGPAARCSDCHGSHDILAVNDPQSRLSPENRMATCRQCHPSAVQNFLSFDPHADHTDPKGDPLLYWTYRVLLTLMLTVFGFFGVHSVLWFVRSLVDVLKNGRGHPLIPGETAYERFAPFHRRGHTLLLVSFLGLAMTGVPLKYSEFGWAQRLADLMGGFKSTSMWHRVFAISTFVCFFAYLILLVQSYRDGRREGKSRMRLVFGPDSPVPNWRDFKDFFRMVRWFFGLGPKPTFERWAYWDKFDFWGAIADVVIIGTTGLMLWFPNFFCIFLPGQTLNIAKVIHSTQALLATGFVFAVHFFNTHLRADKFPADMSVMTGLYGEEEFKVERPEYMERLRREGKLDEMRVKVPSWRYLHTVRFLGYIALAVGLALLAGMIVAAME
jgi:cytochrome b subunit of formate dehydrogenase